MKNVKHSGLHLDNEDIPPIDYQTYDTLARELRSSMTLKVVRQIRTYIKRTIKKLSRAYQEPEHRSDRVEVNPMKSALFTRIGTKAKSSDLAEVLRKISRPASSKIKPSVAC